MTDINRMKIEEQKKGGPLRLRYGYYTSDLNTYGGEANDCWKICRAETKGCSCNGTVPEHCEDKAGTG